MAREMRHSGIEWIGEIPKEWKIGKVKNYYSLQTGFTPDTKNELYYDDENGYPWVNISDLGNSHYIQNTKKRISQYYISKFNPLIVPKGSLLYSFKLSVGAVAISNVELYTNEAIASFLQSKDVNLAFLFYSSQVCIIYNANENIYGAKLLNQDLINNAIIVFPPLSEQQKIADYLDKVCGEVDEMIALQEQMIEELKAYKQSVITEAVTKGLNPNAPMRDSGIDWIGEVPEHWNHIKLGLLFQFKGGYAFNSDKYVPDSNNQVIRIGNVKNNLLLLDTSPVYVDDETANIAKKYELKPGCILFTMTGTKGKRDYFYTLLLKESDFCKKLYLNQRVGCFIAKMDICPNYYNYLLKDNRILDQVFLYETGTANQGNLGIESISRTMLHLPPLDEQQSIASFLDTKCAGIDALIAIKQAKIDELKDYKKSVIYEYVTGKKEVV